MLEMGRYFEQPAPSKPEGPEEWRNPVPPAKNASSANFGAPTGSCGPLLTSRSSPKKYPGDAMQLSHQEQTALGEARQPNFRVKVW